MFQNKKLRGLFRFSRPPQECEKRHYDLEVRSLKSSSQVQVEGDDAVYELWRSLFL
jgi:hypothetical protein